MVKIDGSFIQNLGNQAGDKLFVRMLIELAKSFGITTVGEWGGHARGRRSYWRMPSSLTCRAFSSALPS
jgi:sensor c-di-GMP phosphodiesterase-like protein